MGAFSHKFSMAPPLAAKLLIASKKVMGCKNGTDLLCHHAKYGGDHGSRAGWRKCVMFFFVCLFLITLWNDEVCDNGNAMMQYKFQNNYGVIAQRKVSSCAPMFKFSYWLTPRIFPDGQIFTKNYHSGDFWSRTATFLKLQRWNLACGCGLGAPSPRQNFVKMT